MNYGIRIKEKSEKFKEEIDKKKGFLVKFIVGYCVIITAILCFILTSPQSTQINSGSMLITTNLFILMAGTTLVSFLMMLFLIIVLSTKVPYFKNFLIAAIKNRPWVFLHWSNGKGELLAPKPAGKNQEINSWDLSKKYGIKFMPDHNSKEIYDKQIGLHYFKKTPHAVSPSDGRAITQFFEICEKFDYMPNAAGIDALMKADLDPDFMIAGQITEDELDVLQRIKKEMEFQFVQDGLICWDKVEYFVESISSMNSQNLEEAYSTFNAKALNAAQGLMGNENMKLAMAFVFLLVGGALAAKIAGVI